ncbi:unnamed protein product [Symbiodinium pilosum]|uniref:Uncharacterized protein n=1 Tax=Symbiodinium pilosum TaxID=2952 RepID=A0A812UG90_SYMPI|nr:unnamed protein product [Symbiodinium pilosum]
METRLHVQAAPAVRRQRFARLGEHRVVLSLMASVVALMLTGYRLPEASAAQPARFALRVCEKCVSRKAGSGYNPKFVLEQTAKAAAAAGWPAPGIEWGKCTGGCDYGPNVRLVKGKYAIPVVVEGMTEDEEDFKAFLSIQGEQDAERAFGLASRHIASAAQDGAAEEPTPEIPADTNYGSKSAGAEAEQSVFESQPKRSAAEVSHGEAAKPADSAQSTFESQPQQSKAHTSYGASAASASEPSAFESQPQQSKAAVGYGRNDAPNAGEVQSVFESQPQKSKAMVTAADKVFESQPKQSAAEVSHNDKTFAQGSDKSVFESEPQQSKAEIGYGRNAAASGQEQSVFESKPAESKANYKAGANAEDEESEYETDEEGQSFSNFRLLF